MIFQLGRTQLLCTILILCLLTTKLKYTHKQKLSNTTFFSETLFLEVAERNMRVMEIKYFEFYCKFYYFYEYFELKMIL